VIRQALLLKRQHGIHRRQKLEELVLDVIAETSHARKKKSSMTIHTVFQSNTTSVKNLGNWNAPHAPSSMKCGGISPAAPLIATAKLNDIDPQTWRLGCSL
jgi:hypothetical protein